MIAGESGLIESAITSILKNSMSRMREREREREQCERNRKQDRQDGQDRTGGDGRCGIPSERPHSSRLKAGTIALVLLRTARKNR